MNLSKAKGKTWTNLDGKEESLPLFEQNELKNAKLIVKALEGTSINSAKELLNKISNAIEQLTIL